MAGKKNTKKELYANAEDIIYVLSCIAFADVTKLSKVVSKSGEQEKQVYLLLSETEALEPEMKIAIKSIRNTKEGIKIEMEDKMKALELLGKNFGLFKEKIGAEAETGLSEEEKRLLEKWEKRIQRKLKQQEKEHDNQQTGSKSKAGRA